ncbi:MAG: hypothetical protein J0H15_08940 [Xanthomonadales bacterium]|nr:hypothetical protein [Xanthomonadales bacterium]
MYAPPCHIDVDWISFDPWRITTVRHDYARHPLLQMGSLAQLAERLDHRDQTFSFSGAARANANFNSVALTHPNRHDTANTLRNIRDVNAWMLLRHVQGDPVYRGLVDEILDGIEPDLSQVDPGMCYRAGWIFFSSPRTVTPFHIDRNHVLLLQMQGTKTVYVWPPDDRIAVDDGARGHFLDCHRLDQVHWHEELRERAQRIVLEPDMGVYMPLTSPHMVEMGDEPSLAMSVSYNTDASRTRARQHVVRERARHFHVGLPDIGRQPAFDAAVSLGAQAAMRVEHWIGGHADVDGSRYAAVE